MEIVGFSEKWAADFARMNYRWIEKYFTVEQHDRDILDDPKRSVIDAGGEVFFAIEDGQVVGTVALIPAGGNILELTKMAVDPAFQGRGFGDALIVAGIKYARDNGYETVFLESHHKLAPALSLYRKHGFEDVPNDPNSLYSRADVRMELAVKAGKL
ncbi:MAG: GNAT family N-acetyltransferase [Chloracidobacterium sp.]|nr:GNAT family N-acetyltransferase [Chloracidobacterium sp.]MCO5334635.1 GNAT family N-acetyltransferase [Pyrinomonadaceae bacterium]